MKAQNKLFRIVLTFAWIVGSFSFAMPSAQADIAEVVDLDLAITVVEGATTLNLKKPDGTVLDTLDATLTAGSSTNNRVAFGQSVVSYFVGDAFDLVVYTTDGAATEKTGIPGATDATKRLDLRVWTPLFGSPAGSVMVTPEGANDGATVPDPKVNTLWTGVNAVWAFLPEKDTTGSSGIKLSSSEPNGLGNSILQGAEFSVYFAADLLGVKAQAYSSTATDGIVTFEVKSI
jgi:hypothetical protein